jgi:hypothetical protein
MLLLLLGILAPAHTAVCDGGKQGEEKVDATPGSQQNADIGACREAPTAVTASQSQRRTIRWI